MSEPSYHDVFIETPEIPRTSIFDLPYGIELSCTRVAGWTLWNTERGILLGGEYDKPLRVDLNGHVIVDSFPESTP